MKRAPPPVELQRNARVRVLAIGIAVLAVLGGGTEGHRRYARRRAVAECSARAESIHALWNPQVRKDAQSAMASSRLSYARATAHNVAPWLDGYASAWARAAKTACMNATVRHVDGWSPDVYRHAQWCLQLRRLDLWALLNELRSSKAGSVTEAVQAAADLPPVEACLDRDRLLRSPAPDDPDAAVAIASRLARAAALGRVGGRRQALSMAERCLAEAEDLELTPLRVAARMRIGTLLEEIGDVEEAEALLEHAYLESIATGALDSAVAAAYRLSVAVGRRQGRYAEGLQWWRRGELLRGSIADPTGLQAAVGLDALAAVHRDRAQALPLLEGALLLRERALPGSHPQLARTLDELASVHAALGERARARAHYERALAIWEHTLAPDHTQVSLDLNRLAELEQPRTYHVPYNVPLLERPEIILSLAMRTVHLFDRSTGFSAIYPASPGVLDEDGRSETPTGFFTTAGDVDDPWYWMERRYLLDYFGGFPFLRLTAESDSGQHAVGLHGPITFTCDDGTQTCALPDRRWFLEDGYASHGCVRMEADDIIELFWSMREHPRVPVVILAGPERDAVGRVVEIGVDATLWREGEAIEYGECGPRPDPWRSRFRWESDDC